MTTYKLISKLSAILVSLYNLEVVIPDSIVTSTLGSIFIKLFKLLLNSKYVENACSRYCKSTKELQRRFKGII